LRDQGNSVVVVEHERTLIRGADHLIEIGPKAGHEGGHLVFAGNPKRHQETVGQKFQTSTEQPKTKLFIELQGARTHNLKGVDVKFPVGHLTAVCGVSGSGKTSLIQHTLYPMLARSLNQEVDSEFKRGIPAKIGPASAINAHREVLLVSQASLGRSSRSNIATYIGIFDDIRKILATSPIAQKLKLTPGSFSFNTPGGRCETCSGLGTVTEDLSFLGEMAITCPACQGRRFGEEVLQVSYRDKNLTEILSMTVAEARAFFYDRKPVAAALDTVMRMGLGYLTLGQHTSSFSGGEAQRLKLTSIMMETGAGKPAILILDEPTTGLSDSDVHGLIEQLKTLTAKGHTIIVVEHHIGVLRAADWLIEIGPDAAHRGGELMYQGIPEGLKASPHSVTAPFFS